MTYEELIDALDYGTDEVRLEAKLEIMGRYYYYEGD